MYKHFCWARRSNILWSTLIPIVSRFFGIIVYMYWKDHAPPHLDAKYQDAEVAVDIETGEVTGTMSKRALGLIEEWRAVHKTELLENWSLAEAKKDTQTHRAFGVG